MAAGEQQRCFSFNPISYLPLLWARDRYIIYVIITNLANIVYKRKKAQFIIILTKITYIMVTNVSLIILLYSFIGKY